MIKIGIIGCGKITEVRHAPEYMENPNCELAAFYDLVPGRAEEFAQIRRQGVRLCGRAAGKRRDAVSVCTANTSRGHGHSGTARRQACAV